MSPFDHSLGKTKAQRLDAYKSLFKAHIDEKQPGLIRASWQTGTPLGNDYFKQKVEAKLKCKVGQARRGRPKKSSDPLSVGILVIFGSYNDPINHN